VIVWRDGELVEAAGAVSAADRGFLVGDGVFETLLVENGRAAFLSAHCTRLRRGLAALGIEAPPSEEKLRAAIGALARRRSVEGRAACRITLTRVGGARGLVASADARTQTLVSLSPSVAPRKHARLLIASVRRCSAAVTNGFKCVGAYGVNMIARNEAARAGAEEAILLNEFGRVACASAANLFLVDGDALVTPPESEGAMPGVTRAALIDIARARGVCVRIEPIEADALAGRPLLLTNSLIGVSPARLGSPGPEPDLAMRLGADYEARLAAELSERGR